MVNAKGLDVYLWQFFAFTPQFIFGGRYKTILLCDFAQQTNGFLFRPFLCFAVNKGDFILSVWQKTPIFSKIRKIGVKIFWGDTTF